MGFQLSLGTLLINLFVFVIMLAMARPYRTYVNPQLNNGNAYYIRLFFLLYAFAVIFAFDSGDFYSYEEIFNTGSKYASYSYTKFEGVYNWLATQLNDYITWRCLIWGVSIVFMYIIAKKLNLRNYNLLLALVLFGFGLDFYTRGILGHTMLLLGCVLLTDKHSDKIMRVVGLILFCISYFFHRSMYINIAFAILAFFPLNKKSIVLSYWAFPILTLLATSVVGKIASGELVVSLGGTSGGVEGNAQIYAAGDRSVTNTYGVIGNIIEFVPQYLTLFYLVNRVAYKKILVGTKQEYVFTYLFRLCYVTLYISSLFYFVDTSLWIYERCKAMAFFPLPFVLAKVWSLEPQSDKWVRSIICLQLLAWFFIWFIRVYHLL